MKNQFNSKAKVARHYCTKCKKKRLEKNMKPVEGLWGHQRSTGNGHGEWQCTDCTEENRKYGRKP